MAAGSNFREDAAKLKSRLKTFLPPVLKRDNSAGEQIGLAGRNVSFSAQELMAPAIVRARDPGPEGEIARFPSDPLVDDEILESMEQVYYDEDFQASLHELKKLPATLDQNVINGDRQRLLKQLTVVTKRVFVKILEKQSRCAEEMEKIKEIEEQLGASLVVCRQGRDGLTQARKEFTASSLGILAAYRRRQQAQKLLDDLNIIRTLQKTDEHLTELLSEDNFPGAIQLLLECQNVVHTYKHFNCVQRLSSKLQDTLEMTEEQLDVALSKVCVDFNPGLYSKLYTAYQLLGKTQMSMDQLHMHLTSAIHNTAWNVVYGHAMLGQEQLLNTSSSSAAASSDLSKKTYPDLCGSMAPGSILPCLVDLCRALWNIMNSYRQIVLWHSDHYSSSLEDRDGGTAFDNADGKTDKPPPMADDLELQYVRKKLETGKMRIWQDVQTKTKVFVLANDLSGFSIDNFLEFLDVIHKLIEVGQDFCGSTSPSSTLQESLKKQCWSYFHSYHLARLEELKMHLENEGWALCPVKPTFKAIQLNEFRHLRPDSSFHVSKRFTSPRKKSTSAQPTFISPFDTNFDDSFAEEDVLDHAQEGHGNSALDNAGGEEGFYSEDSDGDLDDELRKDFVDEENVGRNSGKGEGGLSSSIAGAATSAGKGFKKTPVRSSGKRSDSPILTNTSLMLLRLCGKYLHLMQALEPIASNVFVSMSQLIDFYVLAVFEFFSRDQFSDPSLTTPAKLSSLLERIRLDLIRKVIPQQPQPSSSNSGSNSLLASNNLLEHATSPLKNSPSIQSLRSKVSGSVNSRDSSQQSSSTSNSTSNTSTVLNTSINTGSSLDTSSAASPMKGSGSHNNLGPEKPLVTGIVDLPSLSPAVSSTSQAENLFGLPERFIAVESAIYLASQFKELKPKILEFLPKDKTVVVEEYDEQSLSSIVELRRPVYMVVASKSINTEVILQLMAKVAWDIKEVRSQHSQYVDVMLRDFQILSLRLTDIRKHLLHIPLEVRRTLWELSTLCASNTFVEGFSSAKRCSNEGRALMQLDYRQFVVKLEKLFSGELKPLPYQDYVSNYVKAYYIPEMDLEGWVKLHNSEYSEKQLVSLVNCVAYSNNRTKQKLNSLISDLSGRIRRGDK